MGKDDLFDFLVSNSPTGTVHKNNPNKNPDKMFPERGNKQQKAETPKFSIINTPNIPKAIKDSLYLPIREYEQKLKHTSYHYDVNAGLFPTIDEKIEFCIVMPGNNVEKYITQAINSVFIQTYHNWKIVVVDDSSEDKTSEILKNIQHNPLIPSSKFSVITHKTKVSSPAYSVIEAASNQCSGKSILGLLDADDMLAHPNVLKNIANIYLNNPNIWVTFGSYAAFDNQYNTNINLDYFNIPDISKLDNIRSNPWTTSHFKTFYTWLARLINPEDLKIKGSFTKSANDVALMLPIVEMAGSERVYPIKNVTYLYRLHPNNIHQNRREEQLNSEKYFRTLPKYKKLPTNDNVSLTLKSSQREIENFDNILKKYRFDQLHDTIIQEPIKFCIAIAAYNYENYIYQNLNSIFMQNYHNWHIVYIDDHSTDNTLSIAHSIKSAIGASDDIFKIISHDQRFQSPARAYYEAAHNYCQDQEVLIQFDGDDILASPDVLSKLASIYSNPEIFLTFGSFLDTKGNRDIKIEDYNIKEILSNPRNQPWISTHLRTSYTWLFKKIDVEDLKYQGEFDKFAGDMAIMYPMLEMATSTHINPVYDLMHIYRQHPNNDHAVNRDEQIKLENHIRSLPSYSAISPYKDGCLSDSNLYQANMPDQFYVINLDKASKRWEDITQRLTCSGIKHTRFSATNGYEAKITDLQTKEVFYGKNIKDRTKILKDRSHYEINCTPSDSNPVKFHYTAHLNYNNKPVTAGEIGIWCSTLRVLHDAKANGYKNIVIFEDDIVPTPTFKKDLSHFIAHLPFHYDLAYLGYYLKTPEHKIVYNDFVHGFNNQAKGWGAYAYMLDEHAVNILIHLIENHATYAIDNFFWCISTGKTGLPDRYNDDCTGLAGLIKSYASSDHLLDVLILNDETSIHAMGRWH